MNNVIYSISHSSEWLIYSLNIFKTIQKRFEREPTRGGLIGQVIFKNNLTFIYDGSLLNFVFHLKSNHCKLYSRGGGIALA